MRSKLKTRFFGMLLAGVLLAFALPGTAANEFDPDSLLRNPTFKDEIEKIQTDAEAQASILNHSTSSFGITKTIFDFAAEVAGNNYTEQIKAIMDTPVQQWNPSRGLQGSYDIVNVKRIVQQNQTTSLFGRVKDDMGNLATAVSIYSVMKDAYAAYNGNDVSKLKAVKGTYDVVFAYWAKRIAWDSVATAAIGASFVGYALDTFMAAAMGGYSDAWWAEYVSYLETRYPQLVTGNNSWAALSRRGGNAALKNRLYEFWDDPYVTLEGTSFSKPNMASMQMRDQFAARYYQEYVHTTLKTYFTNEAEKAQAKAWYEGQQANARLSQLTADLRMLQMAIQDAQLNEETPRTLIIVPVAPTIEEGQSVSFTTMFIQADGNQSPATSLTTFSGAAGGSVFSSSEVGVFTLVATCEGMTAEAMITVKEKAEQSEEEDELDEAIEEVSGAGEESDDYCGAVAISRSQGELAGMISEVQSLSSTVSMYSTKFEKELADRAADPCGNSLMAYCYTSARDAATDLDNVVNDIRDAASSLLMTLGLCPGAVDEAGQPVSVVALISSLASAGSARGQAEAALVAMASRLGENGCDEEEFAELSDQYTQDGMDPDGLQDGSGMGELSGDGVDNDQDGLQEENWVEVAGKNVTIVVYDSGNFKDDVFSLSVSGFGNLGMTPAGGLRTYGLNLTPGTYTATITVVVAPDNCGTVMALAMENGVEIGAFGSGEGCPPTGSSMTMAFTVMGNSE